jgi:hypothetical protein
VGRNWAALLRRRPRLLAFVAAALFLRLLVPAGYMVGGAGLVPCPAVAAAPLAHHGHHHAPAPHGEAPCPFAALSAPAVPPADPFTFASAPAPFPAAPRPVFVSPARPRAAAPPPPSTGPPAAV